MKPDDNVLPVRSEPRFEVTPEQREFLLKSIAEADRGEVVDGWELLEEIDG